MYKGEKTLFGGRKTTPFLGERSLMIPERRTRENDRDWNRRD